MCVCVGDFCTYRKWAADGGKKVVMLKRVVRSGGKMGIQLKTCFCLDTESSDGDDEQIVL